jgi:hypothetical protein
MDDIVALIAKQPGLDDTQKKESVNIIYLFALQLAERGGMSIVFSKTKEEYIQDLNYHIKNANEASMEDEGMS